LIFSPPLMLGDDSENGAAPFDWKQEQCGRSSGVRTGRLMGYRLLTTMRCGVGGRTEAVLLTCSPRRRMGHPPSRTASPCTQL
jgi:hypothetical protein